MENQFRGLWFQWEIESEHKWDFLIKNIKEDILLMKSQRYTDCTFTIKKTLISKFQKIYSIKKNKLDNLCTWKFQGKHRF